MQRFLDLFPYISIYIYIYISINCCINKIAVEARFSTPVQTGPGAHPASYTMGTGSFPGVKRPGRGIDNPPPSITEVKEKVELYIYSPFGPLWPVIEWTLPLLFTVFLNETLGGLAKRYRCIITRIEKVSPKLWLLSTTLTQCNIHEDCGLNTRQHHHPVPH